MSLIRYLVNNGTSEQEARMDIYTMERWKADRTFKAEPGQEITGDIYENMLNCMPPRKLPQEKAQEALQAYNIPVHAGFLMGEPHSSDKHGQYYLAFGMNDYGKGKHYYYLGLSRPARIKELTGVTVNE